MYRLLTTLLSMVVVGVLVHARAQTGTPETGPAPITDAEQLGELRRQLDAVARDVGSVKDDVHKIRGYTEPRLIDLTQLASDQISNFIWEVIGYKRTEKTIIGKAISLGGALVTLVSLYLKFVRKREKLPRTLLVAVYAYAGFAMVALGMTAFATAAPMSQPTVTLDTSNLERRLDRIEQELASLRPSGSNPSNIEDLTARLDGVQKAHIEISEGLKRHDDRIAGSGPGWFHTLLLFAVVVGVVTIAVKIW